MNLTFRPYTPADRDACLALFKSNMPVYFDPTELQPFEDWLTGQDERRLAYKNTDAEFYYVAEQDNKVVACGGVYLSGENKCAVMTWGMVHNSLHKQGIGKKFLEYRINIIETQYPDYTIKLDTSQHTYQFYKKMEFKVTNITPNFYAKGIDKYDMIRE